MTPTVSVFLILLTIGVGLPVLAYFATALYRRLKDAQMERDAEADEDFFRQVQAEAAKSRLLAEAKAEKASVVKPKKRNRKKLKGPPARNHKK